MGRSVSVDASAVGVAFAVGGGGSAGAGGGGDAAVQLGLLLPSLLLPRSFGGVGEGMRMVVGHGLFSRSGWLCPVSTPKNCSLWNMKSE